MKTKILYLPVCGCQFLLASVPPIDLTAQLMKKLSTSSCEARSIFMSLSGRSYFSRSCADRPCLRQSSGGYTQHSSYPPSRQSGTGLWHRWPRCAPQSRHGSCSSCRGQSLRTSFLGLYAFLNMMFDLSWSMTACWSLMRPMAHSLCSFSLL